MVKIFTGMRRITPLTSSASANNLSSSSSLTHLTPTAAAFYYPFIPNINNNNETTKTTATTTISNIKIPSNYVRSEKIKLKKVLGLTVCGNAALDCSPISGLLAYPAGCTIVLFNAKKQTQAYLVNTSRKAFTSVAFSRCGRYVATGECGINPAIKVWELEAPNGNLENCTVGNMVAEFVDHKNAVTCVAFSPTSKYLVSVGSQHDMIVNVFDWKSNLKVASNKISSRVSAVSFAEDGSYFVTVGNRHVKYWYLENGRKYKDPIPLMGRSAILGDLRDNDFCAVACGKGACSEYTYSITRQGHLVEFTSRRLLDKWVLCRTTNANCISVNSHFILVGCAEAIIRIFNAATLEYITTLPRTHYLGVDVAQGIHINHIMAVPPQAKYPDCIAMAFDEQRSKVSCVYNDHSLYIWDMRDVKRVGKSHSFLYHSTCIWGVETVPYNLEREISQTLPEDSFTTCSSDDTIRVWGLDGCANNELYRKNIYSKELLKVIYIDDDLTYIKDPESYNDKSSPGSNSNYDGRNGVRCIKISPDLHHLASGDRSGNIRIYNLHNLKLKTTIEAHESEVLCLEYSNDKIDRKLLASASRDRLIHVFDVAQDYRLLQTLDDHSSSITSIKFVGSGLNFQMISCGADKSIMFRTFQGNIFLRGTHTSGKTTLYDMEVDSNAKHILTACQDRNIRVYGTQNSKHTKTFKGSHSDEGSLIKLCLDPSGIYVATSCTDKTLAVYDYYSNECMARMYGHSELVTGLKFTNDCRHLISASGDGCIFIWQIPHDMIVTMQARLSQQRLRSGYAPLPRPVSTALVADETMIESLADDPNDLTIVQKYGFSPNFISNETALTPGYKLSDVGQLPQWAKRKAGASATINETETSSSVINLATTNSNSITNLSSSPSGQTGVIPRPRNRWAQRGQIDSDTITDLRSNSESPLGSVSTTAGLAHHHTGGGGGLGNTQTSDYNSASSKDVMYNQASYLSEDSSIDSGMETRRDIKFIGSNNTGTVTSTSSPNISILINNNNGNNNGLSSRLIVDKRKASIRFDSISNNDHDGDVEDISDGERTSSEHGMFYNNISPTTSTDFKVTAMNEDELRKSVRRQKFEKPGLTLTNTNGGSAYTASTGTGTGTSDTEDEGSTPSAEHAERSLASTLGGSSESIPQTSNSFLQQALPDSPANITVLDRNSSGRRSISAKHTENGKKSTPNNAMSTITKSYTSTKKDELLKVINEAKQKLENGSHINGVATKLSTIPEVGYRSLRGSHSISDLSLAGNMELPRTTITSNRYAKTEAFNTNNNNILSYEQQLNAQNIKASNIQSYNNNLLLPQQQQPPAQVQPHTQSQLQMQSEPEAAQPMKYFFNCAAPKSRLQQNYQAMRQVQQHYPPYPYHVGVYQIHPPPGVPFMMSSSSSSSLPSANASSQKSQQQQEQHEQKYKHTCSSTLPNYTNNNKICNKIKRNPAGNARRTPSILKHYKSCPVSPVHEEVEWSANNKSKNCPISEPKRHSLVYAEDARTILDMIQTDTEKMIEEITRKYGDLDDVDVTVNTRTKRAEAVTPTAYPYSQIVTSKSVPDNLIYARNVMPTIAGIRTDSASRTPRTPRTPTGNLSPGRLLQQQQHPYVALAPKHSFSEFYVYQEVYQCERKVSLSDILNDNPDCLAERKRSNEARFLETQRHSSASFFLTSQKHPYDNSDRSQESLISEDFLIDDGSYCNSMESILSDDSDCKSAPMEPFNEQQQQTQTPKHAGIRNFIIHGPTSTIAAAQMVSRSFGSSPHAYNSFDYYMQQRQQQEQPQSSTATKSPFATALPPNQSPAVAVAPYDTFDVSSYNLDKIQSYDKKLITSNNLNLKLKYAMSTSKTYPKLNESANKTSTFNPINSIHYDDDDIIPTSSSKNKQYSARVSKSISSDFAHNRGRLQAERERSMTPNFPQKHSNEKSLFQKKDIQKKPPLPVKPHNLVSTLTSTVEANKQQQHQEQKHKVSSRKSCTFEILDNPEFNYRHSRTASVVRKFERNLQKFEREKQAEQQTKQKPNNGPSVRMRSSVSSGDLAATTQSCLKKVSKFDNKCNDSNASNARRATSMKQRDNRPKISVRFNTVSHIKYTPQEKRFIAIPSTCATENRTLAKAQATGGSLPTDYAEKTFEMFISENGNDDNEHDNMNIEHFQLYAKPEELRRQQQQQQQQQHHDKCKHQKNVENNEKTQSQNQANTRAHIQDQFNAKANDKASIETTRQCNSIKKKIDLIEKLIVMEEQKNEQIRLATEYRLKPFTCDSKQKGYVKSLTMNFDMLARGIEKDIEMEQRRILIDNDNVTAAIDSDHLCAYALHIKRNCSLPDVLESATDHYMNNFTAMADNKKLQEQQQAQQSIVQLHHDSDGMEVELAKEVKADSDVDDNEDEKEDESEKVSLQNVISTAVTGITKSIISSQAMEESSPSMRRACSLSDLHITNNINKNGKIYNSTQKTSTFYRNNMTTRTNSKRNSQQLQKGSINNVNNMANTFNPSDSEKEDINRNRMSSANSQGRSNGQTGSSRNYINKNSNGNNNRRKSAVQSNFNNALQQDDSSSEETQGSSTNIKPTVPPRPRNLPFDYKTKVLNNPNVVKQRGVYEATEFSNLSDNCSNDSKSQVHNVINKLYTTTQTVLQLHANLRNCEDSLMLKELENAVIMTQNMLTNITQNKNDKSLSQQTAMINHTSSSSYTLAATTASSLTATSTSMSTTTTTATTTTDEQLNIENGDYLMMVNNCADLLSNFRIKHKNTDDCENNS